MEKSISSINQQREIKINERDWPFKLVKSHLELRHLETENVWVARLKPNFASKTTEYVKKIRSKQKEALLHCARLRRIQKENEPLELEIILCPVSAMTQSQIEKDLEELEIEANVYILPVPSHAPLTEEQYKEWNPVWPVFYRRHTERQDTFTNKDLETIDGVMNNLIKAAFESQNEGQIGCVAAVYDHTSRTVLSVSVDERNTSRNPVDHCAMRAINLVAKGERERRKLPHESSEERYLCRGLTVLMTHEPCVMCSMALLHSRILRLIYCQQQPLTGGIESSYGIHWRAELNHRYLAYSGWEKEVPTLEGNVHV
ncbi:tRNA specific adenosine deaminase subunit Tad3 [Schizosaccharomyces octosporus yFS286]|uniref:tRNA specific adenosine deaminase subunit Tad3 n=1 Tax=Schizosaccharomyces octosporus (strain yFS286) TaxID=483514 RepID=S9Q0V5_SCHOY|nr:tRNA specific adenosine deaminase subunit Tad3 [Schizosaccharomyces octosporus yFS286]EPX74916.1 tRNA specific adenosine deaminase subunit Tad3 [Schizosaccharomyces octosporus yFS286]